MRTILMAMGMFVVIFALYVGSIVFANHRQDEADRASKQRSEASQTKSK